MNIHTFDNSQFENISFSSLFPFFQFTNPTLNVFLFCIFANSKSSKSKSSCSAFSLHFEKCLYLNNGLIT